MTVGTATSMIIDTLKDLYSGAEPGNIAVALLEHISGLSKTKQVIEHNRELSEQEQKKLENAVLRLGMGEPVQYVTGEAWFAGLPFRVNKNVLIPRPETEELVEWVTEDLRNTKANHEHLSVLDIGTGSGCIPVALKKKNPGAEITAIDVCSEALYMAMENTLQLEADVQFLLCDILHTEEWEKLPRFDIIISNPPYIPYRDKDSMHRNVLEYEPHKALFVPDNDALLFYRAIAGFAEEHLKQGGALYLEIHEDLGTAVKNLFIEKGFPSVQVRKDMQGKERMVRVRK